jgi:hypothetical protein
VKSGFAQVKDSCTTDTIPERYIIWAMSEGNYHIMYADYIHANQDSLILGIAVKFSESCLFDEANFFSVPFVKKSDICFDHATIVWKFTRRKLSDWKCVLALKCISEFMRTTSIQKTVKKEFN